MDRYDQGFKDPQSCESKAMQIAKEAERKGMASTTVSVELLTDLVLHLAAQEQRAEKAEREASMLRGILDKYQQGETGVLVERLGRAEATLAAIRTDLDTYHRDPGHCDLAWLLTRVQGHVGYEPEGQRGDERMRQPFVCAKCRKPMQFFDGICWDCYGGDPGQ